MGTRFVEALMNGVKRCLAFVDDWWKGRMSPHVSQQDETYTDQW